MTVAELRAALTDVADDDEVVLGVYNIYNNAPIGVLRQVDPCEHYCYLFSGANR